MKGEPRFPETSEDYLESWAESDYMQEAQIFMNSISKVSICIHNISIDVF